MKRDFIVNVIKQTRPITQKGFGLVLILSTLKEHPYTLYSDIKDIMEDFPVETKEYKIASRILGQSPRPAEIAIAGIEYGELDTSDKLVTAINNIAEKNNDWYFLTCTENGDEEVKALAGWTDTQEKLYFTTTQNLALVGTMENENTVVMYHNNPDAYVAEGLTTIGATRNVGGITFKFKTVNGVSEADISSTELTQLHKDGGFSYVRKFGVPQTTEGKTTSGEYIDVVMAGHFIKARTEEEVAYLTVNNDKIPYDNRGISMLVSAVDKVLKEGVRLGAILTDENGNGVYEINALTREEVSKLDVANRTYNGIQAKATLAGAIHNGNLSISLVY